MVIVIMGAAGAGKTTVGLRLSKELNWKFADGDAFHTQANREKMKRGGALTDEDRHSWLETLQRALTDWVAQKSNVILACSLLKESYRDRVLNGHADVKLVYLQAGRSLLHQRLASRTGHFAGPQLLDSQLATLEEPRDALVLDASATPDQLARQIQTAFHL